MTERNGGEQAAGIVNLEWESLAHDWCLNVHFMCVCILSCFTAKLHHMELPTQVVNASLLKYWTVVPSIQAQLYVFKNTSMRSSLLHIYPLTHWIFSDLYLHFMLETLTVLILMCHTFFLLLFTRLCCLCKGCISGFHSLTVVNSR